MSHEALNKRPDTRFVSKEATKASALALAALIAAGSTATASSPDENLPEQNSNLFFAPEHALEFPLNDPKVIFENSQILVEDPDYSVEGELDSPGEDTEEEEVLENDSSKIYKKNLFKKNGYVKQPNNRTCVAAATQIMLNIDKNIKESDWKLNTSKSKTYQIFNYARAHDTLDPSGVGSDANGWDEALEHFGGFDEDTYEIRSYKNIKRAAIDITKAIARTGKPVGMVGWAGKHAQVITGYESEGDPLESDDINPKAFYLSDPLPGAYMVNERISYLKFKNGSFIKKLSRYKETDSHTADGKPIYKRWYNKFVVIIPTK